MTRQSRSRRQIRMANILAMASTASALSLSNFQLITSSQVSLGCILAYNAPILGCSSASDFTQGAQGNVCSAGCKRALQSVEDALTTVCGNANVPSTSVLGRALSHGLVELLCPSGKATTASAQNVGPSSTAAVVITQTTRQIGTFSPIPTPTTLKTSKTTSSSSSSSSSSSTDDEGDAETETPTSTSSAEAEPQTTETAETTQVAPAPVVTSSASRPTQTTSAQQTKSPPQTASDNTLGGGSPFDIAAVTSGSQRLSTGLLEGLLFANAFVFLLLR